MAKHTQEQSYAILASFSSPEEYQTACDKLARKIITHMQEYRATDINLHLNILAINLDLPDLRFEITFSGPCDFDVPYIIILERGRQLWPSLAVCAAVPFDEKDRELFNAIRLYDRLMHLLRERREIDQRIFNLGFDISNLSNLDSVVALGGHPQQEKTQFLHSLCRQSIQH